MKTIITTLPIYDRVVKQCYLRANRPETGQDQIIPIVCPLHHLPSFQWLDGSDGAASISKVETIDTAGTAVDITAKFTLPAMIPLEHDYFVYKGTTLLSPLTAGTYYLRITTNNANIYYSEWFKADCIFGNLVSCWMNLDYVHFTTDGADITNAEYSGGGTARVYSLDAFSVRTGDVIMFLGFLAVVGDAPKVKINSASLGAVSNLETLSAGSNTITLTATANASDCSIYITSGNSTFSIVDLSAYRSYSTKYLIINFSNTCDLGDLYYHGGFTQSLYLESETMETSFPTEEEGGKNGEGRFVRTFARQVKKYMLRTKDLPDYMVDVFNRMKLHNTISLTDLVGDVHSVYNIEVEHEWLFDDKYYAKVDLTFDYDETALVSGCCVNIT